MIEGKLIKGTVPAFLHSVSMLAVIAAVASFDAAAAPAQPGAGNDLRAAFATPQDIAEGKRVAFDDPQRWQKAVHLKDIHLERGQVRALVQAVHGDPQRARVLGDGGN